MRVKRFFIIALGTVVVCLAGGMIYLNLLKSRPFCDNRFSDHYKYVVDIEWDPPEVVEQKMAELMTCVRRELEIGNHNWPAKKALDGLMLVAQRLPEKEDEVVALYFEVIDRRSYGYSLALMNLPHFCRSRKNIQSSIDRLKRYLSEEHPKAVEDAEVALHELEKLLGEISPQPAAPQPGN